MRGKLILVFCVLLVSEALGHARLTDSSPAEGGTLSADPATVSLIFSEPLQPRFSDFALHFLGEEAEAAGTRDNRLPRQAPEVDPSRSRVEVALPTDASPGWYLLDWEVLAEDGHTTSGKLRFEFRP
ncbi:MAG: copper resistance protein CopC [Gammaproteobacteria bacterium]|nr:copper resistance protein CopC [Gammaproteobacteria bacterium]